MRFHLDSLADQHDLNILDKNINKDNELFLNEYLPNNISSSKSSKPNKAKPIGKINVRQSLAQKIATIHEGLTVLYDSGCSHTMFKTKHASHSVRE